ncbi:ATP synthase subunit E [Pseudooceanicola batsensis HTCC2597]|uniref:ATP synthase subunit E n=1 Tax=Pseudooceanicola batsensis (strain ATCC BAA-863 / DSM 15984 / KCTC 12145 / HTCC2597) TaxID=252305 RepID=A3U1M2_PSEBH|nr:NADH-quinone oxidoreductase subunit NuoE [Pseudooceanicola batsensis]EAQ01803.1 ATP synthase subunit E [Pseudooceanicola batsensis HTCC2597]
MLRRLHKDQPESFAFTPENQKWAEAQMTKYPEGRQASAIIPLLWRAQEQEGWLTRPAIEHIAAMLDMAYIRALEVATFYFMFQLAPVGSVAHVQICGTTSCMICGAEDLIAVCQEMIAPKAHEVSADGKFSWEEVECLGACANAPMAQIGKDYYEDLTAERLREILGELAEGKVPVPGPQNGRYAAEPLKGLTSLTEYDSGRTQYNASVALATDLNDTVKRIDGTEVPLLTPWLDDGRADKVENGRSEPRPARGEPVDKTGVTEQEAEATSGANPPSKREPAGVGADAKDDPAPKADTAATSEAGKADAGTPQETGADDATNAADATADDASRAPGQTGAADETRAAAAAAAEGPGSVTPEEGEGRKPVGLSAARDGQPDDLKQIKGVGPALEQLCNDLGIYHFDQIAAWGGAELAWIDRNLKGFKGRASRDNWIDQARILASGGTTEFSTRVKKGDVYD